MNVKEFILSLPAADIAEAYADKQEVEAEKRPQLVTSVTDLIEKTIKGIEPVDTGHLILGIRYLDEYGNHLDAALFRKEDLSTQFDPNSLLASVDNMEGLDDEKIEELSHCHVLPESYAFEFSPWKEILGYEVDVASALLEGPIPLAVAVLWEMTFFGFDEANVDAEREELNRRSEELDEILKLPEEEQKKHLIPTEKVFAELGLLEETEEEKAEDYRKMTREIAENSLRKYRAIKSYLEREKDGGA